MFYLPPKEFWYLTVARLTVTFDDGKTGTGTGFFVYDNDQYFLITARHVVDHRYLPTKTKSPRICTSLEISFQSAVNPGTPNADIGYNRLLVSEPEFFYEKNDVDVAAITFPKDFLPIRSEVTTIRPCSFALNFLATSDDLSSRYAGEPVVFVGFPDNAPVNRVGMSEFYYPLLRQGVFAFPPTHGIEVEGELGRNYGLIDSYAQSGFSGGPIIALQKGWADGSWHPIEEHSPAKVIGLVCGHYRSAQDRYDGSHAGLSFFARADSIRDVIEQMQASTN